jgi:hypothetical protein
MLRKQLTFAMLSAALLLGGSISSCSQADKQEASANSQQAYADFQTFVASTEAKVDVVGDKLEADYDRETTELKAEYDAKSAAVDKYAEQYDDARHQEMQALRERYQAAYAKREADWNSQATASADGPLTPGQYYKPGNPAGTITAANARSVYEGFVSTVKAHKEQYDLNDWRNVNAEWRALDEAYDNIKKDVSMGDMGAIQKAKLEYAAVKSWDKTKLRAGHGATAVRGEAKEETTEAKAETADERSKVRRAADNTAHDVKEAGKAVGGAVKNVFDGKDGKK